MKILSSNGKTEYITNLENCNCPDFTYRKADKVLNCDKPFCLLCSCKHQRDNLKELLKEAFNHV